MKKHLENDKLILSLEGRIDSNNAANLELEIMEAVKENPGYVIIVDAEELEYISSAGLRVLMKLRKEIKSSLPIINVSAGVYDIFEMTGFTELFDVKKALRKIDIEGLPVIGQGATAKVYRLDMDTVIKVFQPNTTLEIIHQENERSRNAFLNGIHTAISYDIVRVGDCYGTVYELLDAQDFLSVLENDRKHLDDHIRKFALSMREMHKIEVDPTKFSPVKTGSLYILPKLEGLCTKEEIDKIRKLYEIIPDRFTFVHGDCHPGNVMMQNGELLFIDLMTCGCGHPVFDLGSMCSAYHLPPKFGGRDASPLLRNFTVEETDRIWDVFLRTYLDTEDEEFLRKVERQITAICSARMLFASIFLPGLISEERLQELKQTALDYVDNELEPLIFDS